MSKHNDKAPHIIEVRRQLLAIERELDYPRWTCPCKATNISREHDRLHNSIRNALKATEKLIIHYLDNDTII